MNSIKRSQLGHEIEEALQVVLAHVRGETSLPCRIIDDPSAERIRALRARFGLSRRQFAAIEKDPEAVEHAISG